MPLQYGYGVPIGTLDHYQRDPVNDYGQYYHENVYVTAPDGLYHCAVDVDSKQTNDGIQWRVVPMSATFRFLPLGHRDLQPYIGAGVGVFAYRYSETGDFVSSDNVTIIRGNFVGSGTAAGPVVLGGVRIPIGSVGVGGELRWQSAVGKLPSDQGFATRAPGLTPEIDLGGWTYAFTINFRF